MPKLTFEVRAHTILGDSSETITELALSGFIDAANYQTFEGALDEALATDRRCLLIDFTGVKYINSTGISGLIRYSEKLKEKSGILCLASVEKSVGLSMHLLGVTSLIPFAKDVEAGRAHVGEFIAGRASASPVPEVPDDDPDGIAGEKGATGLTKVVLRKRAKSGAPTGRVLVITPSKSRFTKVLRLRFGALNGDYHLLHDAKEALDRYDVINPDIVVIDQRCDPRGEFVSRVKGRRDRSLTSIIKIYGESQTVLGPNEFKIWENDFLVDPFEVLELFTLTEAELLRVPRDRKVFTQQVHFEFRTVKENVEKAYKLAESVILQSVGEEDEKTALFAAVKEGIDNAVVHGNGRDESKTVDVNFLVDQTKVTVIIEDQGSGFDFEYYLSHLHAEDAFNEAKDRIIEENIRGGLGILLMSRCADRIQYSGPGNILRLEKDIR